MSKLRLSNHKLNIEVGRHKNIARDLRTCPFCVDDVEDEMHFLIKCELYKVSRDALWKEVQQNTTNFINYDTEMKFKHLMENEDTIDKVASFVSDAFEIRAIFVECLEGLM